VMRLDTYRKMAITGLVYDLTVITLIRVYIRPYTVYSVLDSYDFIIGQHIRHPWQQALYHVFDTGFQQRKSNVWGNPTLFPIGDGWEKPVNDLPSIRGPDSMYL
jgi:hypothetical protein